MITFSTTNNRYTTEKNKVQVLSFCFFFFKNSVVTFGSRSLTITNIGEWINTLLCITKANDIRRSTISILIGSFNERDKIYEINH